MGSRGHDPTAFILIHLVLEAEMTSVQEVSDGTKDVIRV
jgi:hypothetical protein